jgi:hypothetical protein
VGVVMDRLGHGPAAAERRALKTMECLSWDGFYRVEFIRGRRIVKIPTALEMAQSHKEIRRCCKRLAKHSRFVPRI